MRSDWLTAVDVETGQLTIFDSYIDEITPEHVSWTTIAGRHYWDGGLVSNSPLDQVVEVGGLTGKNVFTYGRTKGLCHVRSRRY
jgi:hypothetical protein